MAKDYHEWNDEENIDSWLDSLAVDEAQDMLRSIVEAMPFVVHLLLLEHSLQGECRVESPYAARPTWESGEEPEWKSPAPVTLQLVRGGLFRKRKPRLPKEHGPFHKGDS